MELMLIRHGLPKHIENPGGEPADPPLSEIGRTQADRMATWLQHESIDHLYSSPMIRAYETAQPLARAQGLEVEVRDGVAEFDRHADAYVPVEKLKEIDYERWLRLMGFSPRMFFNPDYTSINRYQCARSGERSVITLNEAVHLREVQG
jgi:probable phosphoglycerate mutase